MTLGEERTATSRRREDILSVVAGSRPTDRSISLDMAESYL